MRRLTVFSIVAAGFSLSAAGGAGAQDLGGYHGGMAYGGLITNQTAITQSAIGRNLARETARVPTARPPATDAAALTFRSSAERRRRNVTAFAAKMRAADPTGAASLENQVTNGGLFGAIDAALAAVGLRSDNVADATAAYLMEAWEAVSGRQLPPSRARALAVKRQVAAAIAATPEFRRADDAGKQELAEAMLIHAALVAGSAEAAREGGPDQARAVADAVRQGAQATLGLDLRTVDLTDDGLVTATRG